MEKNRLVVQVNISYELYRKFLVYFVLQKSRVKIIVFTIAFVFTLIFFLTSMMAQVGYWLILIFVYLILLLLKPLLFMSKKGYDNNKQLSLPHTYFIDHDGIEIAGESFMIRRSWNEVRKVTFTKGLCIFWIDKNIVHLLPLEFLNETQLNELKLMTSQYSQNKKRL